MMNVEEENTLFMSCMDLVQEYLMLRKELDILFRDGFLALSKTRYCVGQGRVGLAQIPGQLTATRRVAIERSDDEEKTSVAVAERRDEEDNRRKMTSNPGSSKIEDVEGIIAQLASKYACDRVEPTSSSHVGMKGSKDPVEWFGGFMPPEFTQCQQHFALAMEKIQKLAQIRYDLEIAFQRLLLA